MSPRKTIERWTRIIQRCHINAVKNGNNYRLEKEALDAGIFLFGIESLYGGEYWLRNAEDTTVDNDIQVIKRQHNASPLCIEDSYSLQITQFESHHRKIGEVVRSKQKPGYDPGNIELVIVGRNKLGYTFLPKDLFDEVKKENPKYKTVWFFINDANDETLYHLIQLHPNQIQKNYYIQKSINNAKPPDWIRALPKYSKYIEEKGTFDLPLPPCPICGRF
jgi:hypothetical protein